LTSFLAIFWCYEKRYPFTRIHQLGEWADHFRFLIRSPNGFIAEATQPGRANYESGLVGQIIRIQVYGGFEAAMAKMKKSQRPTPVSPILRKCPSGIKGLDQITDGGLPEGRSTLVCGSAGCGKTVLGMEFLVRGALQYDESGVFMAFEETEEDLMENFSSLGFNLPTLIERKKIAIDHVFIDRSEIQETGEYDLEGLFIRLGMAIDQLGARRVVLDTIESLFSGFTNEGILRAELRRLFRWLKDKGVTAIITAEQGRETFTRHGLEEYVADCVILLDHRIREQIPTRRLRIVKYRGSAHGGDEYPFLIQADGFSLLPITSLSLDHSASTDRFPTGIDRLDAMFGGKGYYRGSNILLSGGAGTGKTSAAAHFADSACKRGERTLFLAFEESPNQIIRNMKSIGINLEKWVKKGFLKFHAVRPTLYALEAHLTGIHRVIEDFKPTALVIDPISNLVSVGNFAEVKAMLLRLIDSLKTDQITTLFTDLTHSGMPIEETEAGISSLMDTWILLRSLESSGERNRTLYIAKSRGMDHSDQIREFTFTDKGVQLVDVYLGPNKVLTGSARIASQTQDKAEALASRQEVERKRRELERKGTLFHSEMAVLKARFESEQEDLQRAIDQQEALEAVLDQGRADLAKIRKADVSVLPKSESKDKKGDFE
jgi:circadian clock protein KaiC